MSDAFGFLFLIIIVCAVAIGAYVLGDRAERNAQVCKPGTAVAELSDHKLVCQFADGSIEIRSW